MQDLIGPDAVAALATLAEVVFINVVLSADNAVVIGMAALGLPAQQRLRALWIGIGVATVLRIGFAIVATSMLKVIGLLLAGGILLLWVAWKLWREMSASARRAESEGEAVLEGAPAGPPTKTLSRALWQIVVADVSMSLDNVLAVAGAALHHPTILAAGLAISVLLMGAAASLVARILERHHWVAYIGLVVILYVAVKMIWHGAQDVGHAVGMTP
ncbi:MAG: YjbE family putative metal transport protein [Rhodospirillales bacterium]|nr:YjbE family putative metal transport protein [Rhodospirillales bacterium]